jgi:hypothetical protein
MIKIEYWNDCDLCDILYQDGFKQLTYLNTVLCEPQYSIDKEAVDDESSTVTLVYDWQKRYRFQIVVPEYMVDAFYTMLLHDNVLIDDTLVTEIDIEHTFSGRFALCGVSFLGVRYRKDRCRNMMLAPSNARLPGGVCYEAEIDVRGFIQDTTGVVQDGNYLIYDSSGYGYYSGILAHYSSGVWTEVAIAEGEGIYNSETGITYYYNGSIYFQYPYISAIDNISGGYHIYGFALPETFVYIYYDDILACDPVPASVFNEAGVELLMPKADYTWKIESKTFSCDYGTSDSVLYEDGFILLNDFDEFILINDDQSKIYR